MRGGEEIFQEIVELLRPLPHHATRFAQGIARSKSSQVPPMIDQGLPPRYAADLVELAGAYIDFAKIKTGTSRLYPEPVQRAKLENYKSNQIKPFIGGQFHEYVVATTQCAELSRF